MTTVPNSYPKGSSASLSDEQLKAMALQQFEQAEVQKYNFPTEIIELPSKGLLYPEGSVLAEGKIEMKYMTAKEEDILTSQNLIKQGVVIDKLLQSMIVSNVRLNDLTIGDKNAIMVAARVLGYGKDYPIEVTCPKCGEVTKLVVDLTKLPVKGVDTTTMIAPNVFEFTLPQTKRKVTFKVLTSGDSKRIDNTLEGLKKSIKKDGIDRELTTRLKHLILSVDDNPDKSYIDHFVDNELFALDSRALRSEITRVSPNQEFTIDFECNHCGHIEEGMNFKIDTNFFWPKS
jgi:rRNA maturation protein Nop10